MPTVSVVVLAYAEFPELRDCLRSLEATDVLLAEVVVIDSSPEAHLAGLLGSKYPAVRVVFNPGGPSRRRRARLIGIDATVGDIVAFLDGDAVPDRRWLATICAHFTDPVVVGAGGRLLSGERRKRTKPKLPGRVLADGRLAANFRVDLGRPARVDHLSGVNMAFRRNVLVDLSDHEYPGTGQWEDADLCWQVRRAGGRLVFDPAAFVHYEPGRSRVGGPRRARAWRRHYTVRNNLALLIQRHAPSALAARFVRSTLSAQLDHLLGAPELLRRERAQRGLRAAAEEVTAPLALVGGEVSGLVLGLADGLRGRCRPRGTVGRRP